MVDRVVKQIQALSSNSKDLKDLQESLKKYEAKSSKEIDAALSQLDPKLHTLGMLHLLSQRLGFPLEDGLPFCEQCQAVFLNANFEQARMELKRVCRLVHRMTQVLTELHVPMRGILALERALKIVQTEDFQLTSVHADLLQLCLVSKCYSRAAKLLETKILKLGEVRVTGFSQADYLRFWYYAGLVWTGLKQYGKAIEAFEACFSAPAVALSAPALEAYKKHILVSLVHRGAVDPKRSAASLMMRNMKALSPSYVEFASLFTSKDLPGLLKLVQDHSEVFMKDHNWGLVQQCIESLGDRQIRALTQTYLTLSLETLAKGAQLPNKEEAQRRLVNMVEAGAIVASINEKDGMVSFGESVDQYDDIRTLNSIDAQVRQAIHLGSLLRQLDDEIAASADFIQKTTLSPEARGFGGPGGAIDPEMMGFMGFEGGGFN